MSSLTNKQPELEQNVQTILTRMDECKYNIKTERNSITSLDSTVSYTCFPCGKEKTCALLMVFKQLCKSCYMYATPTEQDIESLNFYLRELDPIENEEWRPTKGGWISSHGRGISIVGKHLCMDAKERFQLAMEHRYVNRVIAEAFHDKVEITEEAKEAMTQGKKIVVSKKDPNRGLVVTNLKVQLYSQALAKGNTKARHSDKFKEVINMTFPQKIKEGIPYKSLAPILPNHVAFADGFIYNASQAIGGCRFLCGSLQTSGYLVLVIEGQSFYIHRLICWSFKPIEGLSTYDDYKKWEVNHINGDKADNRIENLEWVSHNENMRHAYTNKLNNKVRGVFQYTIGPNNALGDLIATFPSIAEASRQTGEPEHRIRETANGNKKIPTKFWWKFVDPSKTEEFSNKYRCK
jgi:hypothetical protein